MKKLFLTILTLLTSISILSASEVTNIYEINIDGIITSSTADIVDSSIKKASLDNNTLLVIKLNTPGGTLESTRDIVTSILSSKKIPIIVYVTPSGARAASAGSFILLSANYAIMDEGTNVGAAHPVDIASQNIEGDMRTKVESDTVAFMKSIAEKRARPIDPAILMVTKSVSYTATEALQNKIIDAVVTQDDNYISMIKTKFNLIGEVTVLPIEYTLLQKIKNALANPNLLVALLFLGIIMIALEFKIPGTFLFLGIGIISLILFAVGSNIIPINIFALLLVFLGIILLIVEIFVVSFGLLTLGGIVSMIAGLIMLFDGSSSMGVKVSYWVIFIIVAVFVLITIFIGRLILKDFRKKSVIGADALIGKEATVMEFSDHRGRVYIHAEIWNAISDDDLNKDDIVRVTSRDDMLLKVKKIS